MKNTNYELLLSIYDKINYNTTTKGVIINKGVMSAESINWDELISRVKIVSPDVKKTYTTESTTLDLIMEENLSKKFYIDGDELEEINVPNLRKWMSSRFPCGWNTVIINFPSLEQVGTIFEMYGDFVEELHFRADKKDYFEAHRSYEEKFGCWDATIYFDL